MDIKSLNLWSTVDKKLNKELRDKFTVKLVKSKETIIDSLDASLEITKKDESAFFKEPK